GGDRTGVWNRQRTYRDGTRLYQRSEPGRQHAQEKQKRPGSSVKHGHHGNGRRRSRRKDPTLLSRQAYVKCHPCARPKRVFSYTAVSDTEANRNVQPTWHTK